MRIIDRGLAAMPFVIGTLAVAGLVHFGTVLAYPEEVVDDAFSRIAALAPVGVKTELPHDPRTRLPFRDPTMRTVVCRFDLRDGPFRIVLPALDEGFVSLAFYDRSSRPFSGLNLRDTMGSLTTLTLRSDDRDGVEAPGPSGDDAQDLAISAPGAQGFALIEAPPKARAVLDAVLCIPLTPDEAKPHVPDDPG